MTNESMIDRVAAALFDADNEWRKMQQGLQGEPLPERHFKVATSEYQMKARAVIEAMREPNAICHGCNRELEPLAAIRVYHGQCDPRGKVDHLRRLLDETVTALDELTSACEADDMSADTEKPVDEVGCPDDEPVAYTDGATGVTVLTFGHIRRARVVLDKVKREVR